MLILCHFVLLLGTYGDKILTSRSTTFYQFHFYYNGLEKQICKKMRIPSIKKRVNLGHENSLSSLSSSICTVIPRKKKGKKKKERPRRRGIPTTTQRCNNSWSWNLKRMRNCHKSDTRFNCRYCPFFLSFAGGLTTAGEFYSRGNRVKKEAENRGF